MTIIWEYAIIWEDVYGRNDQNVEQRKFLALQGKVMVGSVHAGARFAHLWIPIISTAPFIQYIQVSYADDQLTFQLH